MTTGLPLSPPAGRLSLNDVFDAGTQEDEEEKLLKKLGSLKTIPILVPNIS